MLADGCEEAPIFFLGIDVGTSGTRAVIVDETGRITASGTEEHAAFASPQPGWAEQDPRDWWRAARLAVKKALQNAGLRGEHIALVGFQGKCMARSCWTRKARWFASLPPLTKTISLSLAPTRAAISARRIMIQREKQIGRAGRDRQCGDQRADHRPRALGDDGRGDDECGRDGHAQRGRQDEGEFGGHVHFFVMAGLKREARLRPLARA